MKTLKKASIWSKDKLQYALYHETSRDFYGAWWPHYGFTGSRDRKSEDIKHLDCKVRSRLIRRWIGAIQVNAISENTFIMAHPSRLLSAVKSLNITKIRNEMRNAWADTL